MRYVVLCLLSCLACACSRSDGLDSNGIDCGLGERVFTRNAAHCVYYQDDAPEECPSDTPFQYRLGDYVICGGVDGLTTPWLIAILDEAYPPEGLETDAIVFTDGALIGTAIRADADVDGTVNDASVDGQSDSDAPQVISTPSPE